MSAPRRDALAVFVARPQAAHDARDFTAQILGRWGLSHLTDTASLLVSELITNAIKHAGGGAEPPGESAEPTDTDPRVMLGLSVPGSLLVEVWDGSSTPPTRRTATEDQEDGRGLLLVETLSKDWGCKILTTGGKITWFVLDSDSS